MKFTILTITAALIGFGSAQLSGLPTCAVSLSLTAAAAAILVERTVEHFH